MSIVIRHTNIDDTVSNNLQSEHNKTLNENIKHCKVP